ncbi:hypothetical protein B0H66DRAFT_568139 [Apodospora peruviana]|uniref:NAD-dependent epimerase/dehydratase domain-containing protein n=1 Tax=Apodospora peruviana TaxID=516989 RepID=A0AAE0HWM5_9PEZI|nr:hypothetical protein B0H66DRAFT_568139 [Apodospora peruviana]
MSSKGLVLVTGVNGYIGGQSVAALLRAGYSVRGTARSAKTTKPLFDALPEYADRLQIAEVPDITVEGAFDEAIKGVDAVAHIAAPVAATFTDPEPVMQGAVGGVLRALESAAKEPRVKSFVFMSSIAAIRSPKEGDYTYTEKDWNDYALQTVEEKGKETPGFIIYAASKTAAEKALWKFRDEHSPHFTVTALNPCFVAGPSLVPPASVDQINFTTKPIFQVLAGTPLDEAHVVKTSYPAYVDVRDVARLVVFGIEHPEKAGGERFLAAAHYGPPQAVADILRNQYPDRAGVIAEGTAGDGYLPGYKFPKKMVFDGSKVVKLTGQDYIPLEQTVIDLAEQTKGLISV